MNPFKRYYAHPNDYESLCRKYVIASILYYQHEVSPVEDSRFDNWAMTLKMKYRELPDWFRKRVTLGDLVAGTGYTITPEGDEQEVCRGFLDGTYPIHTSF